MKGVCERCQETHYLFTMGGRYLCVTCFSDRRRQLQLAYRGPERRMPGAPNPAGWMRRRDDKPTD
jgi:hypothetical protein